MRSGPPRILRRLLAWALPPGRVRDGLLGDLDELYAERVRKGRASADFWYARQSLSAAIRYTPRRLLSRGTTRERAGWTEGFGGDLSYAFRTLRASPGFATATVFTLALGIGATLMLHGYQRSSRPGPRGLDAPERLVYLGEGPVGCPRCASMTARSYQTIRDGARSFERVSMYLEWEPALRGTDGGELLDGLLATPEIFATLGVRPLLGRFFLPDEGVPGGPPVVVLGEGAWRRRLGGDSTVIGRTIVLDRSPYTVVGVAPADLVFPDAGDPTEVWAPLAFTSEVPSTGTSPMYQVVARLREDATEAGASAELAVLAAHAAGEAPVHGHEATLLVTPLLDRPGLSAVPTLLLAAVGMVLLIAWINLAGLLAARLSARRRELAVRRALGATPGRVARQLLVEATVLGALGGLCGMAVAVMGTRAVLGSAQVLDVRALGLALALGLTSGVAIGSWPALRFGWSGLLRGLTNGARTATGGIDVARGRRWLMVAEMALATVLLSATGLLARTFLNVHRIEPGFSAERVLALRVWEPPSGPATEPRGARVDRLVGAIEGVPGVERAGAVLGLPYGLGASAAAFHVEGLSVDPNEPPRARMQAATPGYFAALGIPLPRGRAFSDADGADAPGVAIVNEAFARRFLDDRDPIGRDITIDESRWEIVGVIGDVFDGDQEAPAKPEVYRPMRQWARSSVWIALRTRGDPAQLGPGVRAAVRSFDPDIAVTRLLTMDALRAGSMGSERAMLRLMAAFALAAVLVSAVGLYGLISYSVSQRTRELGVRAALGASTSSVLRLVLGQGVRLAATGALIGIIVALATLRVMRSLLFGVSPNDPLTLGGVVALVCGVSLLAALVPARRATRVDPMTSLNGE